MPRLTRDQILSAVDLPTEEVEVPEWGGSVLVRGLTAEQRDEFESRIVQTKRGGSTLNLRNMRARLVALTVVDDTGERLFTDSDVLALAGKSAKALNRVFEVAMRLSGISEDDVEDLAKN